MASIEHDGGEGQIFHVNTSLGVATRNEGDPGPDSLMAHADQAMYHSKRTGRNRISVYKQGNLK